MNQLIPNERASRDFRVKFPDDVMQENLAGQLWFGAEVCDFQFIQIHNYGNHYKSFEFLLIFDKLLAFG